MPAMITCSKYPCPYNGYVTSVGDICDRCKEDIKREEEKYRRLTQKDSRNQKNKKGWKK